jgi:hypothetical protein
LSITGREAGIQHGEFLGNSESSYLLHPNWISRRASASGFSEPERSGEAQAQRESKKREERKRERTQEYPAAIIHTGMVVSENLSGGPVSRKRWPYLI